jgi:hypothetical protein
MPEVWSRVPLMLLVPEGAGQQALVGARNPLRYRHGSPDHGVSQSRAHRARINGALGTELLAAFRGYVETPVTALI